MKFPATKAFGATFAYLAQHAVDLAKALWLPSALLVALQLYAAAPLFEAMAATIALGENPEPAEAAAALGDLGKWALVLMAGSAIAYPMMTAASLIHVVRGEPLKTPFYLRYGGDELRLLAAYILLSVMIIVLSIVGGLAVTVFVTIFALILPGGRPFANWFGDLGLNIALTWFRLRLCVLFPASMATGTIGFGAAWSITKGNAWGLFFFWILIGLALTPIALVMAPFAGGILGEFSKLMEVGDNTAAARESVIAILREMSRLFSTQNPSLPAFAGVLLATTIATTAIINVAAGIAWRYLTDSGKPRSPAASSAMAA